MKLSLLVVVCASILTTGTVVRADEPVTINVTGTIVASPCTIDPQSITKNISLGDDIQTSDLVTAGSQSQTVTADIILTKCPAGTSSVTATFHGTADSTDPTKLYTNTGTAENVAVGLEGDSAQGLGDGQTYTLAITSGVDPDFKVSAYAYSLGDVTPGTINSVVTVGFAYN